MPKGFNEENGERIQAGARCHKIFGKGRIVIN